MAVDVLVAAAVDLVVAGAGLVHAGKGLFGGGLVHAQLLNAVAQPVGLGGKDVDVQKAGMVFQHLVGAASHDDAAFPVRQVADDVLLHHEHLVLHALDGHAQRVDALVVDVVGALLGVRDGGHRQAHAAGGLLDDVAVVKLDAQLLGQLFGNGTAHAGKLAGNGDHILFSHAASSFRCARRRAPGGLPGAACGFAWRAQCRTA